MATWHRKWLRRRSGAPIRFDLPHLLLPDPGRRKLSRSHLVIISLSLFSILFLFLCLWWSPHLSFAPLHFHLHHPPCLAHWFDPPLYFPIPPTPFPDLPLLSSLSEDSDSFRPTHSYNLQSLEREPAKDSYGIEIISPHMLPKSTRGHQSSISQAIH